MAPSVNGYGIGALLSALAASGVLVVTSLVGWLGLRLGYGLLALSDRIEERTKHGHR